MENNTNNLYHHGVKGQRWGFRRYQNKDGSLTSAGRKRAAKLESQYSNLTGRRFNGQTSSKRLVTQNKSSKEMSDDELRKKTNRMRLENEYDIALNTKNKLHPKQVSKGRAFINKITKDVLIPAATEVGKNAVKNILEELVTGSTNQVKANIGKKKK